MKRTSFILMAFALVMTITQCKKNEEQPTANDNVVTITLNVNKSNGSKVVVDPAMGTVDFETGDKLYVGSGGKYVGFLTHNGTNFSGNITNPTENQPLQFYFLGNVIPQETLSAGTTEECSVIISDQTEHLPVISCAASNENYVSGVTAYSAHLLNKCALVKFNVTTPSNSPICITGMKNKVTVDFANNTLTPSQDGEGIIMLPARSGENVEKWAILLPQEALEEGEEGSVYSEDGNYTGIRPEIPAITDNGYLADGITLTIDIDGVPVGAIKGLFTINEKGDQVYFSQGNLQYQASTNTWRFAEKQWMHIGIDNENVSESYSGWIDLFAWGTSNYNHGAVCYKPFCLSYLNNDYYAYGNWQYNLFDQTGQADWGYNAISNGGNIENSGWRTPTVQEWEYMINSRSTSSGIRWAQGNVGDNWGIIVLPDNWNSSLYELNNPNGVSENNIITDEDWTETFESNGAIFLASAGQRYWTHATNWYSTIDTVGLYYWTSSATSPGAYCAHFTPYLNCIYGNYDGGGRSNGFSVRLVKDCNP